MGLAGLVSGNSSSGDDVNETEDRVIWRRDLMQLLGGKSADTIRRYLKDGKLPKPDVDLSMRTKGWKVSTLRAAGINVV